MPHSPTQVDFLVIGCGIAGLGYALEAARLGTVAVLAKREVTEAATRYAQGGIAAVWQEPDSFEAHISDTIAAGAGLNDVCAVEMCVRRGPAEVRRLIDLGVRFSLREDADGYDLGKEGGHTQRRVLHAGDITGKALHAALLAEAHRNSNIRMLADHAAIDLVTARRLGEDSDRVLGAYVLEPATGRIHSVQAAVTMLATGGAGKVYLYTSNPDVASGDGIAMAYRAGATVANMEFVQFHPTCLFHPEAKNFLISEAVRGEGAVLRLADGSRFMHRYDEREELAPRDIVARAIDAELKVSGAEHVMLDASHLSSDYLRERFPSLVQACLHWGFDMTREPIPVVPAAHYFCGGVRADLYGRTDLPGLFACGETSCTGVHGANRLASNSLLEAAVFASRAASVAAEALAEGRAVSRPSIPPWDPGGATDSDEEVVVTHNWDEIRRLMWNYVGIVRSDKRLRRAMRRLELLSEEIREYYWDFHVTSDLIELRNIAVVASLVVRCAQLRRESRGLHYNLDCPDTDERWLLDTVVRRGSGMAPVAVEQHAPID
jgi:L-aspartate oxidase